MSKRKQPNPGSDKAWEQGCLCPVLDNGHGNEELGKTRGFWITADCPLHGEPKRKQEEQTMERVDENYIPRYIPLTDADLRRILKPKMLPPDTKQYIKEVVQTKDGNWLLITAYDLANDIANKMAN